MSAKVKKHKSIAFILTAAMLCSCIACFFNGGAQIVYSADEEFIPATVMQNGSLVSSDAYIFRGTPYISVDTLKSLGSTGAYTIDTKEKRLNITLKNLNMFIGDAVTTDFIKSYGGTVYLRLKDIDGTLYAPLNTICQFAKLGYALDGNTIHLIAFTSGDRIGRIVGNNPNGAASFSQGSGRTVTLIKGDVVFIVGETAALYKVKTLSGETAYVMKGDLSVSDDGEPLLDYHYTSKKKQSYASQKINLVWHYVGTVSPVTPDENGGIDILAPTWFDQVVNGGGEIENNGDLGYTNEAHRKGFQVWATITNNMSTKGSTKYTTDVLENTVVRNKTIAQYLFYSCLYDVDGINIDYETIKDSDRDNFTAFVQEMRKYTQRLGLVLSVDTLIPKPWTVEYDYKALGDSVDYLAVMTYDEHYAGSPVAGSVSSQGWYTASIEDLLDYVPAKKILMGVPLYTRLWSVNSSGKPVTNKALSLSGARELVNANGVTPTWLTAAGQYYAEYKNGLYTDKMWLEDSRSVANRLSYVYTYSLAGTACWQYALADDTVFSVFEAIYKNGASPGSYKQPY